MSPFPVVDIQYKLSKEPTMVNVEDNDVMSCYRTKIKLAMPREEKYVPTEEGYIMEEM